MTVRARGTQAVTLFGFMSHTARTTLPLLSTNRTSNSNLMPKLWTCLQRSNTSASPSGSVSRPSSPVVRSFDVRAKRASVAMTVPRVRLEMVEDVFTSAR
jgi:hypothetical protein